MTDRPTGRAGDPANQFLAPEKVIGELAREGARRAAGRSWVEVVLLSAMAGGLITAGALFSTLIATGTDNEGVQRLLEGFGFSVGFFAVVLSGGLLFTEVNVEMPATLLGGDAGTITSRIARLWILAAAGNLLGAFLVGLAVTASDDYSPAVAELFGEIVEAKMRYRDIGGAQGFFQAVLSGALANWLVGMAAFLAVMGRTIIGKYIPVLLLVSVFVASGFLHSPANMAYFALTEPEGLGPGWVSALQWGIVPAAIGNVLGAFFFVALPFWYLDGRSPPAPSSPTEP